VDVRGNVDTRLRFVQDGVLDAVVLALAGLARLGRDGEATEVFSAPVMLPAPGQGALAVECRADDVPLVDLLAQLDDAATRLAVTAERRLLRTLEAGCAAPLGAIGRFDGTSGELTLEALVASTDGRRVLRASAASRVVVPEVTAAGSAPDAAAALDRATGLGDAVARELLDAGAAELVGPAASGPSVTTDRNASAPAADRIVPREGDQ
jgi:hydroxymethylbilane synthase